MLIGSVIGYGDLTISKKHIGCVELLNSVQKRIRPKYHVFGQVHEGISIILRFLWKHLPYLFCQSSPNLDISRLIAMAFAELNRSSFTSYIMYMRSAIPGMCDRSHSGKGLLYLQFRFKSSNDLNIKCQCRLI